MEHGVKTLLDVFHLFQKPRPLPHEVWMAQASSERVVRASKELVKQTQVLEDLVNKMKGKKPAGKKRQ